MPHHVLVLLPGETPRARQHCGSTSLAWDSVGNLPQGCLQGGILGLEWSLQPGLCLQDN